MNKTQAGRLLTLAYFLKTEVPRRLYDQDYWCRVGIGESEPRHADVSCGTQACAGGWCTALWPNKFRFSRYAGGVTRLQIKNSDGEWWSVMSIVINPAISFGGAEVGMRAMMHFFGLTNKEYLLLFSSQELGDPNWTPKRKAKQIEQLVDEYGFTYAAS